MAIKFNDNIKIFSPKPLDDNYSVFEGGVSRPYNSLNEIINIVDVNTRFIGQTFLTLLDGKQEEYWFIGGIALSNLEKKIADIPIDPTPPYLFEEIDYDSPGNIVL